MPKKDRVNMKRSKSKRIGKKQRAALQEKQLTAASTTQLSNDTEHAANRTEQQATSKPANHSEVTYRKLYDACAKSKHLAGRLTQQRSGLQLSLPTALPSALIIRALNKEADRYKELHVQRIAPREDQLELLVDGMREEQLTTLIEELDDLIGDFTGRS